MADTKILFPEPRPLQSGRVQHYMNAKGAGTSIPSEHQLLSDALSIVGNELVKIRAVSERTTEPLDRSTADSLHKLCKAMALLRVQYDSLSATVQGKNINEISDLGVAKLILKQLPEDVKQQLLKDIESITPQTE